MKVAQLMRRKKLAFAQHPRPPDDAFEMIVRTNNIALYKGDIYMDIKSEIAQSLIRATGCSLEEALAIKPSDIIVNVYGNIYVKLGMGSKKRVAFAVENDVIIELLAEAKVEKRPFLIGTAVQNYNFLTDRVYYANRFYNIISANNSYCGDNGHFHGGKKYDELSLRVVARAMGFQDIQDLGALLRLKA